MEIVKKPIKKTRNKTGFSWTVEMVVMVICADSFEKWKCSSTERLCQSS